MTAEPKIRTEKLLYVDGQGLKRLVEASLLWLRYHQPGINALNVFPVPDGDTGTNMLLTMQGAWHEIEHTSEENVGKVAQLIAHGALMGARGNSGVILSQLWRGFARSLDSKPKFGAEDLAHAMREASETAYKGVLKPVEGTILTVSRAMAEATETARRDNDDLMFILDHIVSAAKETVANTPNLLPVLKQAGVVDSGGQGLTVILEGMLRYLRGESLDAPRDQVLEAAIDLKEKVPPDAAIDAGDVAQGYSYDVQCIIKGHDMDVDVARERISEMGLSTLVVGDAETIKVHVHVPRPSAVLAYAETIGRLNDVVVEDMAAQYQQYLLGRMAPPIQAQAFNVEPGDIATLAVAPGDGLTRVFQSLGTTAIVPGGQTMNPSTQDFVKLLEAIPVDKAILLPNNGNVVMAARQAAEICKKHVIVVPSKTIPQGIAAMLAFNDQRSLEDNAQAMEGATHHVLTGEITTATRAIEYNDVKVEEGHVIGLLNDELTAANETMEETLFTLLDQMDAEDLEIVTLYYGNGVTAAEAETIGTAIREKYSNLEVEIVEGGQPHYYYIISAE
ncbi:MAG TPA: DAK2 domain-containing protein [Anaerolineae bacterium]|nr:DAK2 domain-containing protein [Anaerolineae bacterium]